MPTTSRSRWAWLLLIPLLATVAACGSDDEGDDAADEAAEDESTGSGGGSDDPITLGYSAWPGWFVWAVADEAGMFEEAGVEVELTFFADYLTSLEAMAAGELDANSQTLNDTLVSVSTGADQRIVIVNDNSAGNDAIIADESIQSIADLEGKTIAAEQGVVDHFLLLQGLATEGLTEDDIDFRPALTDAAATGFADGEFDAVGVFAPFTLTALERPGSHVLFDSSDFPGTIPDHLVVTPELVEERPEDVQKLVDAWYATLDYMAANPDEALAILAEAAGISTEEYAQLQAGTRLFSAEEALEAFEADEAPVGLRPMAEQVSEFLVDSGLAEEAPPLDDLFEPSFTQDHLDRSGG
ncbi:MAG TPA: ABC transporter substrate-binding protein [Acidimicrobiales bacterium]